MSSICIHSVELCFLWCNKHGMGGAASAEIPTSTCSNFIKNVCVLFCGDLLYVVRSKSFRPKQVRTWIHRSHTGNPPSLVLLLCSYNFVTLPWVVCQLVSREDVLWSCIFKMFTIGYRAFIKFLTKESKSPAEIKQRLGAVYGESSPSYSTVKEWAKQFRLRRESIEDDLRQGRPAEALTPEIIALVQEELLQDRWLKTKEVSARYGLSKTTVLRILHDHLRMYKVSARRVPKLSECCPKATTCWMLHWIFNTLRRARERSNGANWHGKWNYGSLPWSSV
jgi:transposase